MSDTVTYQWAMTQYNPQTERGKAVMAHVGRVYYLVNKDRGKNEPIIVAFKCVKYPIPAEYTLVTDEAQIEKLERWDKPWLSNQDRRQSKPRDAAPEKVDFNSMFPSKKDQQ